MYSSEVLLKTSICSVHVSVGFLWFVFCSPDAANENSLTVDCVIVNVSLGCVQITNNQKFGLCEALLRIGSWELAKNIMSALPPFSIVSHKSIAQCLCRLIHYVIEPLYFK